MMNNQTEWLGKKKAEEIYLLSKQVQILNSINSVCVQNYGISTSLSTERQRDITWQEPQQEFKHHKITSKQAFEAYRKIREVGDNKDNPKYPFPKDGTFSWEEPDVNTSKIRYTEGEEDAIWMNQKAENYLIRITSEGKVSYLFNDLPKK